LSSMDKEHWRVTLYDKGGMVGGGGLVGGGGGWLEGGDVMGQGQDGSWLLIRTAASTALLHIPLHNNQDIDIRLPTRV
jgi:hypothetical protein